MGRKVFLISLLPLMTIFQKQQRQAIGNGGATSRFKKKQPLNQWHCTIDQMVVVLVSEYGPRTGEDPPCSQLTLTLYMEYLLEAFEVTF